MKWIPLLVLFGVSTAQANPFAPSSPQVTPAITQQYESDPLQWEVEPPALHGQQPQRVTLRLRVPPGLVVYRDQLMVKVMSAGGLEVGQPDYPPGMVKADPADPTQKREVYDMDVVVHVPVKATAATPKGLTELQVWTHFQGCQRGLCFAPQERVLQVLIPVQDADPEQASP